MAPEHKFATSARLCQEVLSGAADGALPLSECSEVIGDALRVLSSNAIKVAASRAVHDADADADASADAASIAGAAKWRLVSQMMKKHLVEAVVPVIIELKRIMEASRHPLLGSLMTAAAAMLKDHKTEIEDILAADRQLAKEILYDIRQEEAADAARAAEEKESAAAAAVAGSVAQPIGGGNAVVVAKTPGPPPGSTGTTGAKTPYTGRGIPGSGLRRSSLRPPGTSSSTPIAAEVLRRSTSSGGKPAAAAAALPTSASGPGSGLSIGGLHRTHGGPSRMSGTPRSAGITPGARRLPMSGNANGNTTSTAIARGYLAPSSGPTTTAGPPHRGLSRLARASTANGIHPDGGLSTSTAKKVAVGLGGEGRGVDAHARVGGIMGLTSPGEGDLYMSPAQPKLRPQRSTKSTPQQRAQTSGPSGAELATGGGDSIQDKVGGKEEDHVELQFAVPGAVLGEMESPRLWNVSAAVIAPEGDDADRQGGAMVAPRETRTRKKVHVEVESMADDAMDVDVDEKKGLKARKKVEEGLTKDVKMGAGENEPEPVGRATRGRRRGRSEKVEEDKVDVGIGARRKRKG